MHHYLVVLRDDPSQFADLSPAEMEAVIARYQAWTERIAAGGHLVAGEKLVDGEGRVLVRKGSNLTMSEGPFVETKEMIGGFYTLKATSYEAVSALLEDCPHLEFGSIEVRAIQAMEG